MFRVDLSYTIQQGTNSIQVFNDQWVQKVDSERRAIAAARADATETAKARYGRSAQVFFHHIQTVQLVPCPDCGGRGYFPSMDGSFVCSTCNGKKYFEARHVPEP